MPKEVTERVTTLKGVVLQKGDSISEGDLMPRVWKYNIQNGIIIDTPKKKTLPLSKRSRKVNNEVEAAEE